MRQTTTWLNDRIAKWQRDITGNYGSPESFIDCVTSSKEASTTNKELVRPVLEKVHRDTVFVHIEKALYIFVSRVVKTYKKKEKMIQNLRNKIL